MGDISCCFQEDCVCQECTPTVLKDMNARSWDYRVEGAQNLIFAHQTSAEVLRLANSRRENENISLAMLADHRFVRAVLCEGPLRPYVMFGKLVSVTDAFVDDLKARSEDLRPEHRSSISSILAPQPVMLLQKDLTKLFSQQDLAKTLSTICVEVKPKCGLTSTSRICRAPVFTEIAPTVLRYSPSDLFSGDYSRILRALEALRLLRASTLRVFHDGGVAVSNNIPVDVKPAVLQRGLLNYPCPDAIQEFESIGGLHPDSQRIREFAYSSDLCRDALAIAAKILAHKNEVLHAILYEQKRDFLGFYGAEVLWDQLVENLGGCEISARSRVHHSYFSKNRTVPVCEEIARARQNLSYKDSTEALVLHCDRKVQEARAYVAKMSSDAIAYILADFLTAAVVKDCSLMISFSLRDNMQDVDPEQEHVRLDDGGICVFAIHVVDLGIKPCHKIKFWARREKDAVDALTGNGKDI